MIKEICDPCLLTNRKCILGVKSIIWRSGRPNTSTNYTRFMIFYCDK